MYTTMSSDVDDINRVADNAMTNNAARCSTYAVWMVPKPIDSWCRGRSEKRSCKAETENSEYENSEYVEVDALCFESRESVP